MSIPVWARRFVDGPARENAFGSLLIQASQRLARLIVVVAAAGVLAPEPFAALAVALALTDLVRGALQAFDVDAVRRLSRGEHGEAVVQASLDAKSLASVVGLATVALIAALVDTAGTATLVIVTGAGVLTSGYGTSFLVRRQAALALRPVSTKVSAASLIGAALAVALVAISHGAFGAVVGLAIGDGLVLAASYDGHRWRRPDWRSAVAQIRQSQRLLVMQLAHIGQFRVGTIVLSAAGLTVAVGQYSIASRMAEGLVILAAALTSSSLPMMGAAHVQDESAGLARVFARSYDAGLRIVAPLVGALVVAAPIWIALLFPRYPDIGPASAIVGLAVMIFFASSQTTALLNATHHDRPASWSAVSGLAVSTLASVALAPLGSVGVACARVSGEFVRLLVEAVAAIRYLAIRPAAIARPWLALSPVLLASAIAAITNWQLPYLLVAVALWAVGSGMLLVTFRRTWRESA